MSSVGATRWPGQLLRKVVGTHEQRGCHTVAWTVLLRKVVGTHERQPHGGQLLRKVVGTHEQRGCHTVAWTPVAEGGGHT